MSVHRRMVTFATIAALTGLLIVGLTAYEGNLDYNMRQKITLLNSLLGKYGSSITEIKKHTIEDLAVFRFPEPTQDKLITNYLFNTVTSDYKAKFQNELGGYGVYNGDYFIWSYISKNSETTAIVHKSDNEVNLFLSTTGAGFVGAGIFVMYFMIWTSLIVASLIRRLDQQNAKLKIQANHDHLTGLPNRVNLKNYITEFEKQEFSENCKHAVVIMDLDHFKKVNDSKGHETGDRLLMAVASSIKNHIRKSDYAARIGGDEFILIFPDTPVAVLKDVLERLTNSVRNLDGQIGVSFGAAYYPLHGATTEEVIRNADQAMYSAKNGGMNIEIFSFAQKDNQQYDYRRQNVQNH